MEVQSHDRRTLGRRSFVKASLVSAALAIPDGPAMRPAEGAGSLPEEPVVAPEIIDTNVHLFRWPFRDLKYDRTEALVREAAPRTGSRKPGRAASNPSCTSNWTRSTGVWATNAANMATGC